MGKLTPYDYQGWLIDAKISPQKVLDRPYLALLSFENPLEFLHIQATAERSLLEERVRKEAENATYYAGKQWAAWLVLHCLDGQQTPENHTTVRRMRSALVTCLDVTATKKQREQALQDAKRGLRVGNKRGVVERTALFFLAQATINCLNDNFLGAAERVMRARLYMQKYAQHVNEREREREIARLEAQVRIRKEQLALLVHCTRVSLDRSAT